MNEVEKFIGQFVPDANEKLNALRQVFFEVPIFAHLINFNK